MNTPNESKNYIPPKNPKKKKIAAFAAALGLVLAAGLIYVFASSKSPPAENGPHVHSFRLHHTNPASCSRDGEELYMCDCGETQTRPIPAHGHIEEIIPACPSSPSENGSTEGLVCSACGEILVPPKLMSAGSCGLEYVINADETCTITGMGECKDTEIMVPEYIEGCKVTEIGDRAFLQQRNITDVLLPNGIKKIGELAFTNCEKLNYINLPEGLESIGAQAFQECESMETFVLPDSLKYIGPSAFLACEKLFSINIPTICRLVTSYRIIRYLYSKITCDFFKYIFSQLWWIFCFYLKRN